MAFLLSSGGAPSVSPDLLLFPSCRSLLPCTSSSAGIAVAFVKQQEEITGHLRHLLKVDEARPKKFAQPFSVCFLKGEVGECDASHNSVAGVSLQILF